MIRLEQSLSAWGSDDFNTILVNELKQLDADDLHLQEGLIHGSYGSKDDVSLMILGVSDEVGAIQAKVGVFYTSVIAGCNCADDPTPVDVHNEYCELIIMINKEDASATIRIDS